VGETSLPDSQNFLGTGGNGPRFQISAVGPRLKETVLDGLDGTRCIEVVGVARRSSPGCCTRHQSRPYKGRIVVKGPAV
jgi:hypothetical protein